MDAQSQIDDHGELDDLVVVAGRAGRVTSDRLAAIAVRDTGRLDAIAALVGADLTGVVAGDRDLPHPSHDVAMRDLLEGHPGTRTRPAVASLLAAVSLPVAASLPAAASLPDAASLLAAAYLLAAASPHGAVSLHAVVSLLAAVRKRRDKMVDVWA